MQRPMNDLIAELRKLDRDQLIERFRVEAGREPRQVGRGWLIRRLAWRAQERRLGGLSATARATLERLIGEVELPSEVKPKTTTGGAKRKPNVMPVGTDIQRDYKGDRVVLRVEAEGFRVEGCSRVDPNALHKSVSAAAEAVCGQHVSGRLWWRLVARSGRKE